MEKRGRILWLDCLRGFAMINMLLYHALYDLVYLFAVPIKWFSMEKCYLWQQGICWTFILVSGVSIRLGKRPWKNGIKILICAIVLSAATLVAMPSEAIYFGILHFAGSAILITWLLLPILKRVDARIALPASFILFLLCRQIPSKSYDVSYLFWLGFPDSGFQSADYFPLLPWIFLFWTGYYAGCYLLKDDIHTEKMGKERRRHFIFDKTLGLIGRNSLLVYMLHQPIIFGILWVWHQF